MGYRSEVVIVARVGVIPEKLRRILIDEWRAEHAIKDKVEYFRLAHVKWYQGYQDVDDIENVILDYQDDAGLVRVGEENGDVEVIGSPYEFGVGYETKVSIRDEVFDET